MNKQEKQVRVDALRRELVGIDALVVAENKGLSVTEVQALRKALRDVGGTVRVIKNTLARLSIKGTSLEVVSFQLVGPILVVFGVDPSAPAKAILKVAADQPKLVIKGGCVSGKALDLNGVKMLSMLPSRDELRSMLLGTLLAVPTKFVGTLAASPRSLLNVLNARKEQLAETA